MVVNQLMKKQGAVELSKIAKNYKRILPIYRERIRAKPEVYDQVCEWYDVSMDDLVDPPVEEEPAKDEQPAQKKGWFGWS